MNTLDFLNKNMFRKYPIQDTCEMLFTDGEVMPTGIVTSMQLSTKYGFHDLYVSKVSITQGFISLTINNSADNKPLGCFSGKALTNFAIIPFISYPAYPFMSGSMTIGRTDDLLLCLGTHFFDTDAKIEDSVIFCFTPPPVVSISNEGTTLTGMITTSVSRNMSQTFFDAQSIQLTATDTSTIMSNNEFSGGIDTCPTPIIKKINTVSPDSSGNIDIFGILPISINVLPGEIEFVNPLELVDVCPEKNKISPPVNNSNDYYTNILEAGIAEWRTWDRFNPP